jgi:hypothetical protein
MCVHVCVRVYYFSSIVSTPELVSSCYWPFGCSSATYRLDNDLLGTDSVNIRAAVDSLTEWQLNKDLTLQVEHCTNIPLSFQTNS